MTGEGIKQVKALQRKLRQHLFDPGPVDGKLGRWTHLALKYQAAAAPDADLLVCPLLTCALRRVGQLDHEAYERLSDNTLPTRKVSPQAYNFGFLRQCAEDAFGELGSVIPRVSCSPELLAAPSWRLGIGGIPVQTGDIFGVRLEALGDVGHCGLVLHWEKETPFFLAIEALHTDVYDRETHGRPGIRMIRRLKSDVFCATQVDSPL